MSTSTHPPVEIDTTQPGIGLGRLVAVEWRKMTDTIGGRWLMIVTAALLTLVAAIMLLIVGLNDDITFTANEFATSQQFTLTLIVPVFCILISTSEWGQRTNLATFTLEPRRSRVLLAKLLSVVLFSVVTAILAIGVGSLANVLQGVFDKDVVWNLGLDDLAWLFATQLALNLSAFALGLLILNSAFTIAIFYVIAIMLRFIVWPILSIFDWARDIIPFLDVYYGINTARSGQDLMGDPVGQGYQVAVAVVSVVVWIVIPGALGWLRATRSEVK